MAEINKIEVDGVEYDLVGSGGGVIVQSSQPIGDPSMLWIDTGNGNIAKYWNGSAWTTVKAVWG